MGKQERILGVVVIVLGLMGLLVVPAMAAVRGSGGRLGSHMSTAQKVNVQKLQADVADIKSGSQVTQAQKDALANDLSSMAKGATKPSQASVSQLSQDLTTAMADGNISSADKAKLMKDVGTVMNSANISSAQINRAVADAQTIISASGINQADAQLVAQDLRAIVTEAKSHMPSKP